MGKSGLISTYILFDYWQRIYIYQLFTLLDGNLVKDILSITLKSGNGSAQPREQPKDDRI